MSFELLSGPIRKYIRDKRWEQLRPIQLAAIERILSTENNYILASRTASGKTEAAFLPILSKVNFNEKGVQVLYISPLIALINDQFFRIEDLCKNLEVGVTKWHGEANRTLKEKLLADPSGVVLITPESIEAMFVNKLFNVKSLFSNLKFIVIDEIHSFVGTDRGIHLKSLLSRLQQVNLNPIRIIGLSATIGDFEEVRKFTGDELKTKILRDTSTKDIDAAFYYFKSNEDELTSALIESLYEETKDNKVLIFPNSRGKAEEVSVKLKKISDKRKGHPNYFSHHSSVDKEVREFVENFAKTNYFQNFAIACTSTLELGIDIGTVDKVVQIDATHSVASLVQRIGRSGRKDGAKSNLVLYATDKWLLLQSLACYLLYKEGFIEPPLITDKPYDLLLHQIISITKGHAGIKKNRLIQELKQNFVFKNIEDHNIEEIVEHLISIDFLEQIRNEVIIGIDGEKIINKDFYSVFKTEESFKVVNGGTKIGEVPFSTQIIEDANILLAAKIWKIKFVDFKAKKIEVIVAKDGKRPMFFGGASAIHRKVREKMFEILYTDMKYEPLDELGMDEIEILRSEFGVFNIIEPEKDKPVFHTGNNVEMYTFTGSRINRTIQLLLNIAGIESELNEKSSLFSMSMTFDNFKKEIKKLSHPLNNIEQHIQKVIENTPNVLEFSKWGHLLPLRFQVALLRDKYYDIDSTKDYLDNFRIAANK